MFSLNEISDPNVVKVFVDLFGNHCVMLPDVECLEQLEFCFSKLYLNDALILELSLEQSVGYNSVTSIKLGTENVLKFGITDDTEIRWNCERGIIRLWVV